VQGNTQVVTSLESVSHSINHIALYVTISLSYKMAETRLSDFISYHIISHRNTCYGAPRL